MIDEAETPDRRKYIIDSWLKFLILLLPKNYAKIFR